MSTSARPTVPPFQLTSDQLTVIVASTSSLVLFVVIVALVSVMYRKDLHCCKVHSYQESHRDVDAPPQYYSSRQTLVDSLCVEPGPIMDGSNAQQGQLFYVGLPSSYSLPSLEDPLPRLPSYESVRKKDRQRQIHMMIADRFGLNGPLVTEPPPTYEESVRHSIVVPFDILSSNLDPQGPTDTATVRPVIQSQTLSQCSANNDINNFHCPV